MKRTPWRTAELETLKQLYPGTPTKQIALALGRTLSQVYQAAARLKLHKSAEYLNSPDACRLRRGDRIGAAFRFQPGQVPPNKGLRRPGWAPGRMAATQFQPGVRQGIAETNWCPIGTIRTDGEGFMRIKVREGVKGEAYGFGNTKIWPLLNRHIWEQHHGPIPASHAVVFKDRDRSNCDITNLELLTRKELMLRNTVHKLPRELVQVIQLTGALKRKLRRRGREEQTV